VGECLSQPPVVNMKPHSPTVSAPTSFRRKPESIFLPWEWTPAFAGVTRREYRHVAKLRDVLLLRTSTNRCGAQLNRPCRNHCPPRCSRKIHRRACSLSSAMK